MDFLPEYYEKVYLKQMSEYIIAYCVDESRHHEGRIHSLCNINKICVVFVGRRTKLVIELHEIQERFNS